MSTARRKDTGRPGNGGKYDHAAGSRSGADLDAPVQPGVEAIDDAVAEWKRDNPDHPMAQHNDVVMARAAELQHAMDTGVTAGPAAWADPDYDLGAKRDPSAQAFVDAMAAGREQGMSSTAALAGHLRDQAQTDEVREPTLREKLEAIANPPLRKPRAGRVKVGNRLDDGRLVTRVEREGNKVSIWLDGHAQAAEVAISAAGRVSIIDQPPVDLSDPDEFEDQVRQIADREIGNHLPEGPILEEWKQMRAEKAAGVLFPMMGLSRKNWATYQQIRDLVEKEVRFDLHRASQGEHASSTGLDDPRIANGRAKTGDDVIDSATGEAYRVISKQPAQVISRYPGEDGLPPTALAEWKDDPSHITYTLQSLRTGERLGADLRGSGWKRIPAPATPDSAE